MAGSTGVTFFVGTVAGMMTARLRYTRTWVHDPMLGWRIVAAHIAVLPPRHLSADHGVRRAPRRVRGTASG